ncbi:hypothetical protein [Fulvimarina sp. MAC3]|uniref:hypothetical protein n=1 Tax=Fulvimarina sp. MAC3 TaxID=3148887 RepID=UPI0031FC2291
MPDSNNRTTEAELSFAILGILRGENPPELSVQELINRIPAVLKLTNEDQQQSATRPGEEIWEQRVRNIKSHHDVSGNYLQEGYLEYIPGGLRLTQAGRIHWEENI